MRRGQSAQVFGGELFYLYFSLRIKLSLKMFFCLDINECQLGIHDCQQLCTNTEGSFQCSCTVGFQANSDGTCTGQKLMMKTFRTLTVTGCEFEFHQWRVIWYIQVCSILPSEKKKNKKVSFVRGSVKSFIPAGASDKRCTAYFSPSVPCVVNMKSSIWISLLDVSEQDQLM